MGFEWFIIGYTMGFSSGGAFDLYGYKKDGRGEGYSDGYNERERELYQALERLAEEHQLQISGVDSTGRNTEYKMKDILDQAKNQAKE